MHVHMNQVNPNAQLDAMYAVQRADAKREAERIRKKLLESASAVAGEAEGEACVVRLGERESSQEKEANRQSLPQAHKGNEDDDTDDGEISVSDWA
jgi:hypothetical protein